jgi:hypothetical protein
MYIELTISRLSHPYPSDSRVDRLEWLERKGQFLLFTLFVQDSSDKDTKTIIRDPVEEFELLLGRSDGRQDGKSG